MWSTITKSYKNSLKEGNEAIVELNRLVLVEGDDYEVVAEKLSHKFPKWHKQQILKLFTFLPLKIAIDKNKKLINIYRTVLKILILLPMIDLVFFLQSINFNETDKQKLIMYSIAFVFPSAVAYFACKLQSLLLLKSTIILAAVYCLKIIIDRPLSLTGIGCVVLLTISILMYFRLFHTTYKT